jgi:hypothetical protein
MATRYATLAGGEQIVINLSVAQDVMLHMGTVIAHLNAYAKQGGLAITVINVSRMQAV